MNETSCETSIRITAPCEAPWLVVHALVATALMLTLTHAAPIGLTISPSAMLNVTLSSSLPKEYTVTRGLAGKADCDSSDSGMETTSTPADAALSGCGM